MTEGQIDIKYAIYIDKGGKDALEVVVDTIEQAQKERDVLKGKTAYICIEKTSVRNFGKLDEQIIASEVVEEWDASVHGNSGTSGKLSDSYKVSQNGAQQTPSNGMQQPVQPPAAQKKNDWRDYYANNGAIIGYGYFFEDEKPQTQTVPQATPAVPAQSTEGQPNSTPQPNVQVNTVVLANEGGQMNGKKEKMDKIVSELNEAKAKNVTIEGENICFESDDSTDHKKVISILAKAAVELKETAENKYKAEID